MSEIIFNTSQISESETLQRLVDPYVSNELKDIAKTQQLSVSFTVRKLENEFLVQGNIQGVVELECSRCLEPARWTVELPFAQSYTADQTSVDIEPEVRDALLTSLPQKALCSEECRGLCPVCGANKNKILCQCRQPEGDIRLTKLNEFFKK